jgi:hypothetical protein
VSDGAELGSAVHEYRHSVVDERLPSTGRRLPPDWALQTLPVEIADLVALVRREMADLHAELPRNGLVAWTAGNVSARVREPSCS